MSIAKTTNNPFKQGLAKTIGQGFSTIGGNSSVYYTLFYLDSTVSKAANDHDPIVVGEVFLGRDGDCIVRYGENFPTVSRKHAALRWENGNVVLHHISTTNSTYVNDQEVMGQRVLQNGDIIKLSSSGPRIRFNIPEKGQQGLSSMGMTARFAKFASQGLKPYRYAIWTLTALLLAVSTYGTYRLLKTEKNLDVTANRLEETSAELVKEREIANLQKIELDKQIAEMEKSGDKKSAQISNLYSEKNRLAQKIVDLDNKIKLPSPSPSPSPSPTIDPVNPEQKNETHLTEGSEDVAKLLQPLEQDIYYVYVKSITIVDPKKNSGSVIDVDQKTRKFWTATGYLCKDGTFITARHVVQPWRFIQSECGLDAFLSHCSLIGKDVSVVYEAQSPNVKSKTFTFTSKAFESNIDESADEIDKIMIDNCGENSYFVQLYRKFVSINIPSDLDFEIKKSKKPETDWAFLNIRNRTSNIEMSREVSSGLIKGETLYILGFPAGDLFQDEEDEKNIEPILSTALVSQSSIKNGRINVTQNSFFGGNSGGPVFAIRDGKPIAVGLVSAGIQGSVGVIIPVQNIR